MFRGNSATTPSTIKRIRRAAGWSIFAGFLAVLSAARRAPLRTALRAPMRLKLKGPIDAAISRQMAKDPLGAWGVEHGMYVFGVSNPYGFSRIAYGFQIEGFASRIGDAKLALDGMSPWIGGLDDRQATSD